LNPSHGHDGAEWHPVADPPARGPWLATASASAAQCQLSEWPLAADSDSGSVCLVSQCPLCAGLPWPQNESYADLSERTIKCPPVRRVGAPSDGGDAQRTPIGAHRRRGCHSVSGRDWQRARGRLGAQSSLRLRLLSRPPAGPASRASSPRDCTICPGSHPPWPAGPAWLPRRPAGQPVATGSCHTGKPT
jgi:hypothetical protein